MNNLLRHRRPAVGQQQLLAVVPPVQLEPVRIGDHRRPGQVGLLRRQLRLGRQRHQRRLEPRLPVEPASTSSAPASAARPKASASRTTATTRKLHAQHVGFTSAQFHPELNPLGVIPPFVRFGLNTTGIDTPDFTYDSRLGSTAYDWLASVRDNLTLDARHAHVQGRRPLRVHAEQRGARRQLDGRHHVQQQHQQPAEHQLRVLERASSASSRSTPRPTSTGETQNRQWWSEWYGQDTWQATLAAHGRLRRALPLYSPYYAARRPGRELRSVEVRPGAGAAALHAGDRQRHARRVRSGRPASRSTRSSSAPTCPAPATRPTAW